MLPHDSKHIITPFLAAARCQSLKMLELFLEINPNYIYETDSNNLGALYHASDMIVYYAPAIDNLFTFMQSDPRCTAIINRDLAAITDKYRSVLPLLPPTTLMLSYLFLLESNDIKTIKTMMSSANDSDLYDSNLRKFLRSHLPNGDTPLEYAKRCERQEVVKILNQPLPGVTFFALPKSRDSEKNSMEIQMNLNQPHQATPAHPSSNTKVLRADT